MPKKTAVAPHQIIETQRLPPKRQAEIEVTISNMPSASDLVEYNKIHKEFGKKMLENTLEKDKHHIKMRTRMIDSFEKHQKNNMRKFYLTSAIVVAFGAVALFVPSISQHALYAGGLVLIVWIVRDVLPQVSNAFGKGIGSWFSRKK